MPGVLLLCMVSPATIVDHTLVGWHTAGLAGRLCRVLGKRVKHRVVRLYTPATLNNAPFDFIFGVDKLYVFVKR